MKLEPSGSQTVGPYFSIGLEYLCTHAVPEPAANAVMISVRGRLLDADCVPVPDAMLELWQADPRGVYTSDERAAVVDKPTDLPGFARVPTDSQGCFWFTTAKPGMVPFDKDRMQAPHIVVLVFMRGLLRHLITRMYFPDEPANEVDPVLALAPADRQGTMIAGRDAEDPRVLHWDILLQGEGETVFFAW